MKLIAGLLFTVLLAGLSAQTPALAKSAPESQAVKQRYIVVLQDPPLATYDGRTLTTPERGAGFTSLEATSNRNTRARKLDVDTPRSKKYLQFLDERSDHVRGTAALELGRELHTTHRYRNAMNGFATSLTADEAMTMRKLAGVKSVIIDKNHHLNTDAGPDWIGADDIHIGNAGFAPSGGEGIVVGVIDSGINWSNTSFQDNVVWNHQNPYGKQLGLCSDATVECNDKLVGVYDFVTDDPETDEIEENSNGLDNSGHGSHTASTAAGNPRTVSPYGKFARMAGVAPNANIVSYRVCFVGDPELTTGKCQGSAIVKAIDQAIIDKVDVINYSIGSDAFDPWHGEISEAFLNARAAGIFVAAAAGNSGPNPSNIDYPANAPWVMAVGSATHNRVFSSAVQQLSGGDTPPPGDLLGASNTTGIGVRNIVHARDFGNALCGIGEPELNSTCAGSTGATNPFPANTFNGEIVVCDRGDYGRVEKGKNLFLAGAGGYILANTELNGESVDVDNHCLPAIHLGKTAGDELRDWLASGSSHQGSISEFSLVVSDDFGDQVSSFSSRGPNLPPVENVLKPDLIAPGASILAAWIPSASSFGIIGGTSMASPHIAGAAALIKSVHPDWTPPMITSALMMTATPEQARDFDAGEATPHDRGAGRPILSEAVNAALYLEEDISGFIAAEPRKGGDPKNLNLPGLVDSYCLNSCNFTRTVTDLVGGASWMAEAAEFPSGIVVSISPQSFSLADGASRSININIDLSHSEVVGSWVYGEVRLSSAGHPDAVFTVAVFADGGELPYEWKINSDDVSGWQEYSLSGLTAMPDATFTSGGLVEPTETIADLLQDPTENDPYDDSAGLLAIALTIPPDTMWFRAETLISTAVDLDLYVGIDANHDGIAQKSEEICSSHTPEDEEFCDFFTPVAGDYWVIVQNWKATNNPDKVTLKTAIVSADSTSPLVATGNGIVAGDASQKVRLSWDNVSARQGTDLLGAVGIGTRRESPNNIGIIPVTFTKTGVANPDTLALMNGLSRGMTIDAGGVHDLAYIDVPPGAESLTVTVDGGDVEQSEKLELELYRMDFDDAFETAPFALAANSSGTPIASAMGGGGIGPRLSISGSTLSPGRWYTLIRNTRNLSSAVQVKAEVGFSGSAIPLKSGLWDVSSRLDDNQNRKNTGQGYDYASTGDFRALLWYTYDEDGNSDWYLAAGPETDSNIWVAQVDRYTNDGTLQHATPVGHVSVTMLAEDDSIFSFVLYGRNGSDRMIPTSPDICPTINNSERSYTGLWSRKQIGVGGASGLVNGTAQAFIHFIFDDNGKPRWLLASPDPQSTTEREMPLFQFGGYCAVCNEITRPTPEAVGVFTRDFADETHLTWTMDYMFNPPLSGSIKRTDDAEKLTLRLDCQ